MDYLVCAIRMQLIRLPHMDPGTRVRATERIPSGPCHAVESADATEALCGAEVSEVLEQQFAQAEWPKCADCEALATKG